MTATRGPAVPLVSFRNVTKVYPGPVLALDAVTVDVLPGTIHAFVGENGAGKSTLMKVLSGEVRPDRGEVALDGSPVRFASASDAMAVGIGMVHQEILLVDELTVWENVVLGIEPVRASLFINSEAAKAAVQDSINRFGLELDATSMVGALSVAARQKVEICKLLYRNASVLIFDEPTAVLTPQEVPKFFDEIRRLAASGRTICFITHHLDEVLELTDTVTVLRDGQLVATVPTKDTTISALTHLMVERDLVFADKLRGTVSGEVVLAVQGLIVAGTGPGTKLGPVDFVVRAGEILGVAGVEGNGQREVVEAIVGMVDVGAATITVSGVECSTHSILERRRLLAYVPAERKTAGASIGSSIVDNVVMGHHRLEPRFTWLKNLMLNRRESRKFAREIRKQYSVEMRSVDQTLGSLSGGNQQKVILGRELSMPRPLTILEQPTRGLDVGSIENVHDTILRVRAQGGAVLLVSSDLDELLRISDRIMVLFRGQIADEVAIADATLQRLGRGMLEGAEGLEAETGLEEVAAK
jgi:general nucleoside transport system ATP-binding protein